jgi:hypothetical protein
MVDTACRLLGEGPSSSLMPSSGGAGGPGSSKRKSAVGTPRGQPAPAVVYHENLQLETLLQSLLQRSVSSGPAHKDA